MTIRYEDGKQLQLWVHDKGVFEGFAVFLNGKLVSQIGDQSTHKYPIARPTSGAAIVIHFGGADGGISAIVDVTDPNDQKKLQAQSGVQHSYLLEGA